MKYQQRAGNQRVAQQERGLVGTMASKKGGGCGPAQRQPQRPDRPLAGAGAEATAEADAKA